LATVLAQTVKNPYGCFLHLTEWMELFSGVCDWCVKAFLAGGKICTPQLLVLSWEAGGRFVNDEVVGFLACLS